MFFYVFKMAVAIAFVCKNAVEAIWISSISMILSLNCFYSISANRRKQKDWFLWKNMHQCMSRNWENTSSMLQSPPKELFYVEWTKSFTVLLHWIYDCEVTVSEQLILGALTTNYLTTTALLSS